MFHKHYPRTNLCPSLSPIAHFVSEIERLLYDRTRTIEIEKLRPKGVVRKRVAFPHGGD